MGVGWGEALKHLYSRLTSPWVTYLCIVPVFFLSCRFSTTSLGEEKAGCLASCLATRSGCGCSFSFGHFLGIEDRRRYLIAAFPELLTFASIKYFLLRNRFANRC